MEQSQVHVAAPGGTRVPIKVRVWPRSEPIRRDKQL
jgi:hypothetical protein